MNYLFALNNGKEIPFCSKKDYRLLLEENCDLRDQLADLRAAYDLLLEAYHQHCGRDFTDFL